MFDICVLGSANLDHFIMVSHLPKVGETLESLSTSLKFGGKVNFYIREQIKQ
jgi:hypothetical protein